MANKQGTNPIVDAFIGDKLIEARYTGAVKYFDAYTELTGSLPLSFDARAAGSLKNYRVYGDADGSGMQTENIVPAFTDATYDNLTVEVLPSNTLRLNGSNSQDVTFYAKRISLSTGTYSMNSFLDIEGGVSSVKVDVRMNAPNGVVVDNGSAEDIGSGKAFTIDSTTATKELYFVIRVAKNYACSNLLLKPTLVTGSTIPTSFIPVGYKIPLLNTSGNLFTEEGSGLIQVTGGGVVRYGKSLGKIPAGDYDLSYIRSGQVNLFVTFKENGGTYRVSENNPTAFTVLSTDDEVIIRTSYASDDKTWAELGFTDIVVNQQSNYDLYVGSTKLGEEEYVDYESGKVYKRTVNLWDEEYPDITSSVKYRSIFVGNGNFTMTTDCINIEDTGGGPALYLLSGQVTEGASTNVNGVWNGQNRTVASTDGYITVAYRRIGERSDWNPQNCHTMIVLGSTAPQTYIPYLQPTNPPIPLPAISAYKGENTLSSTETVGEVSVKGRISTPPSVWTDLQWSIYPSISFAALSEAVHLKPGYYYVWQNVIGSSDFGVMVLQPDDFSGGIFGNKGIYHIETEGNYAIQINKNNQSKTYSSAELEALSSGSGIKASEHTGCTWSVDPNAQYIAFSTMVTLEAGSYLLWQEIISASDFSVIVLQSEGQSTITPNVNGICTVSNPGKYWMQINKNNVSKTYTSAELEALSYGSGLVKV